MRNDRILQEIYTELGIRQEHLLNNRLKLCEQPPLQELEIVTIDYEAKPFILLKSVANAWNEMVSSAKLADIALEPFSGFRSYLHQKRLIKGHLEKGRRLEDILTHIAIPGYSEHHSGRAIDIYTDQKAVLDESFEKTSAYSWLMENAGEFGFGLSYSRNNSHGIIFEPWHWYFSKQS